MNRNNIFLTGDLVIVKNVSTDETETYLKVRRYATMFKSAYDMDAGLWDNMKRQLIDDITGKNVIRGQRTTCWSLGTFHLFEVGSLIGLELSHRPV